MIWIAVRCDEEEEQNMDEKDFSSVFLMIAEQARCDI